MQQQLLKNTAFPLGGKGVVGVQMLGGQLTKVLSTGMGECAYAGSWWHNNAVKEQPCMS